MEAIVIGIIKHIECKELYRLPITSDIIKEVCEAGILLGKRNQILGWVVHIEDLSEKLKFTWYAQYSKEFREKLAPLFDSIIKKLNILEANNVISLEFDNSEIAILDLNRDDYKKLYERHNYIVYVDYKQKKEDKNDCSNKR